ncbi:MAG: T9SS type A sorting domain-containing protein [Flavobacteriales bacterium]
MKRLLHILLGLFWAASASAQIIVGYEYWFDENDAGPQRTFVPGSGNWNNTTLTNATLSYGPHTLHIRLKDSFAGQTRWSSVVSRQFVNGPGGPYELVAVRYWLSAVNGGYPADMRYKYFDTPLQFINDTIDFDFCGWNSGNNQVVKFQLLDNHGFWSSVVTRTVNVVFADEPNAVTSITSPGPYCPGDQVVFTANHTVVAPNGTPTSFTWTVPTGSGWGYVPSNGNTITVTIGSAAGTISVVANNYCGSSGATTLQVVPVQPATLTSIIGATTVCENDTVTYTTQAFPGTYHWSAPQGWSFIPANPSGSTANASPDPGAQPGNISVYVTNACGDNSNTVSLSVSPAFLSGAVTAINWPTEACTGTQVAFDVTPATAATGYEWLLPGGATGTSTNPFLNFIVGSADGTVTANATNACGDGPLTSLFFNALQAPAQPGAIVGSDTVCGNDNVQYSVPFDPDVDAYLWVYPGTVNGWNWADDSTNVLNGTVLPGADDGFITVFAANQCDTSTGPTPIQLTVLDIPVAPTSISGPDSLCSGASGAYSVAAVPDAAGYGWDWPNGWSGTTGNPNESVIAGATAGVLEVVAWNQCGTSPISPLVLSVLPVATVPLIMGDLSICAGDLTTLSIQNYYPANSYTWSNQSTDSTTTVGAGSYTVLADSGVCAGTSSAQITVSEEDVSITLLNGNMFTGQNGLATIIVVPPPDAVNYHWTLPIGWNWDPNDTDTTNATALLIAPADTGSFVICVTALGANGCTDDSCWTIHVDLNVGVEVQSPANTFSVHPNPSAGVFFVDPPAHIGLMDLTIHDASGKLVWSQSRGSGLGVMNLADLANGCYSLTVDTATGRWRTTLVIHH